MSEGATSALWITAERPDPALSGGNIRQHHMLASLAAVVPTDLLLLGEETLGDAPIRSALHELFEIQLPPRSDPSNRSGKWLLNARLMGRLGPREIWFHTPNVLAAQKFLAKTDRTWDVVVIEHHYLARLAPYLGPARKVLTLQNIASSAFDQSAALLTGRRKVLARQEARTWRRVERSLGAGFDAVITVSEPDAAALPSPSTVVANGVDFSRFPATRPVSTDQRVVFIGHLSFAPNVDGVCWFVRSVWPKVLEKLPEARLDVVGRSPHPQVQAAVAGIATIVLHPDVPDVKPFLIAASLAIVPLRFGTGTRLKALEAMAAGIPLVGTSIGLDGIDLVDGVHALVRDGDTAFADAIVQLLGDPLLTERMTKQARSLVEEHYDWAALGSAFVEVVLGSVEPATTDGC